MLVTFFSFILFAISSFHCSLTVSKTDDFTVNIGYWARESMTQAAHLDKNQCSAWNSLGKEGFDGVWKFGKAIGVVGTIIAFGLWCMSSYVVIFRVPTHFFVKIATGHGIMAVLSLLLLSGLSSDVCKDEFCKIGPGGILAIVTWLFWTISTCIILKIQALSRQPEFEYPPSENKESKTQPSKKVEQDDMA
jgi:hypothetical protein